MIYKDLIERLVEHYATMALNPGTLEHARYQVRMLKNDKTGLFAELPELVKNRIDEKKKQIQTKKDHG